MNREDREYLIESLVFLTGKERWWWKEKTDKELEEEYDRIQDNQ